ncbi:hypothetical protein GBAR_LOCUS7487 [Geodia barretti]|uniref:Uncharacterized protein n=1 Tax=Geodia barretti TaxID=519541 RepID=A0AA35WBZ6_GEOBA|nr:hypothetical protein GBAR_LOCUS7487 [Geodia barretti]
MAWQCSLNLSHFILLVLTLTHTTKDEKLSMKVTEPGRPILINSMQLRDREECFGWHVLEPLLCGGRGSLSFFLVQVGLGRSGSFALWFDASVFHHLPARVGLKVAHTAAVDTGRSPASGELHHQSCYLGPPACFKAFTDLCFSCHVENGRKEVFSSRQSGNHEALFKQDKKISGCEYSLHIVVLEVLKEIKSEDSVVAKLLPVPCDRMISCFSWISHGSPQMVLLLHQF